MNLFDLKDKHIVVAGGLGLIGRHLAQSLEGLGCRVSILDLNLPETPFGENIKFESVDLVNEASLQASLQKCHEQIGVIHGVVNCSYPRLPGYGAKLEKVSVQQFQENLSLHLGCYFSVLKEFSNYFISHSIRGSLVSFSSIYGFYPPRFEVYGESEMTMPVEYSAVKGGLRAMSRYFAKYYRGKGLRFNLVSPGGVRDKQPESFLEAYDKQGNSKGMIDPSDLSGAVAFLVSDSSSCIDGQEIVVDDGWTL